MSERLCKITTVLAAIVIAVSATAGELTHEFKNPSFSGNGYSNHVLALEQLRYQRQKEITEKLESEAAKAKREEEQVGRAPDQRARAAKDRRVAQRDQELRWRDARLAGHVGHGRAADERGGARGGAGLEGARASRAMANDQPGGRGARRRTS